MVMYTEVYGLKCTVRCIVYSKLLLRIGSQVYSAGTSTLDSLQQIVAIYLYTTD